jgi:hypothetical protein
MLFPLINYVFNIFLWSEWVMSFTSSLHNFSYRKLNFSGQQHEVENVILLAFQIGSFFAATAMRKGTPSTPSIAKSICQIYNTTFTRPFFCCFVLLALLSYIFDEFDKIQYCVSYQIVI